jgi:hypothetical protein
VLFSRETLPAPVDCESSNIVIERSEHWFFSSRHDRIDIYSTKRSLASLGLAILAAVFHEGDDDVEIGLTNPASQVARLKIARAPLRRDTADSEIAVVPASWTYAWIGDDELLPRNPLYTWENSGTDRDLPELLLTNENEDISFSQSDLAKRDVVQGFGSLAGSVRFAELLLNLSRPWVTQTWVILEGFPGLTSVSRDSAWVRVYLPGDEDWPTDLGELS